MYSPPKKTLILGTLGSIVVSVFLWEYILLEWELDDWYAPSDALNTVKRRCIDTWEWIGWLAAKISSYLTWVRLEKLFEALRNLVSPVMWIAISPLYSIKGYLDTIKLYDHPWKIIIGSVFLVSILVYIEERYRLGTRALHWIRAQWRKRRPRPLSSASDDDDDEGENRPESEMHDAAK